MKRITIILIAVVLAISCAFIVPDTECFATAKAKYVKVKQETYSKMKKTIASQKKTITARNKTIASQKKTITARDKTIASQKKTIESQKATITENEATIKDKKSTISWLWGELEALGYFYNYDTHKWEKNPDVAPIEQINMENANDVIPLLTEQTGLTIDVVALIESWKSWYCYYVEADGDLYVITVKNKVVDVITQLN